MNYDTFVQEAKRTQSDTFDLDRLNPGLVEPTLREFIRTGENLDKLKKALYYNSQTRIDLFNRMESDENRIVPMACAYPERYKDTIHGVLGMATEAVEMVQAVYHLLYVSGWLDAVNLLEEIGDSEWYKTLLVESEDILGDVYETNIAKLRKRYPDTFSAYYSDTQNRKLDDERGILNDGLAPKEAAEGYA